MNDGLNERERAGIRAALATCPKVRRAVLFGSRAMGTYRGVSDVDLALEGDDLRLADVTKLQAQLAELDLPFEVDLVVRASIRSPEFEAQIQQHGRVWYKPDVPSVKASRTNSGAGVDPDDYAHRESRTRGREATSGVIPGRFALSVGMPDLPAPAGWRWAALTDVAQLESGHTPSRKHPDYWDGGVPWIGIKDAVDNHGRVKHVSHLGLENSSARLLPAGTVCLSRTASVGYVVVMGRVMATSQDFVNWVCGPALEPHFLKYVLLGERDSLFRFASGTTHQTIYYPEAKAFHVLLPPIEVQQDALAVLRALDDKIELNRRTNETLEAMARALFKSWFVDFDPVRAKADGRRPAGLDAETAALFPSTFVDSDLGPIPRGWKVAHLADVTSKIGSGATPRGGDKAYVDDGMHLIRSQNVYDSDFIWDGLVRITDADAARLAGVTVAPEDVLLNITGASILRTCVVDPAVLPARVNQHVAIVRAIKGIPPSFIHQCHRPRTSREGKTSGTDSMCALVTA